MRPLTDTNTKLLNASFLLLRLTIGSILFVAGAGKVLGWFGGEGMEHTVTVMHLKIGIPPILAYMSMFTEFLGGFALCLGLLTRPAAFAVIINMLVATIEVAPKGFFGPGGASYPFSLMITALVLLLSGPFRYSIDALLERGEVIYELRQRTKSILNSKQFVH